MREEIEQRSSWSERRFSLNDERARRWSVRRQMQDMEITTPGPESTPDEVLQWAAEMIQGGATRGNLVGKLCEAGWPRKSALELVWEGESAKKIRWLLDQRRRRETREYRRGRPNGPTLIGALVGSVPGVMGMIWSFNPDRSTSGHSLDIFLGGIAWLMLGGAIGAFAGTKIARFLRKVIQRRVLADATGVLLGGLVAGLFWLVFSGTLAGLF